MPCTPLFPFLTLQQPLKLARVVIWWAVPTLQLGGAGGYAEQTEPAGGRPARPCVVQCAGHWVWCYHVRRAGRGRSAGPRGRGGGTGGGPGGGQAGRRLAWVCPHAGHEGQGRQALRLGTALRTLAQRLYDLGEAWQQLGGAGKPTIPVEPAMLFRQAVQAAAEPRRGEGRGLGRSGRRGDCRAGRAGRARPRAPSARACCGSAAVIALEGSVTAPAEPGAGGNRLPDRGNARLAGRVAGATGGPRGDGGRLLLGRRSFSAWGAKCT